jgi:hypothetical protein
MIALKVIMCGPKLLEFWISQAGLEHSCESRDGVCRMLAGTNCWGVAGYILTG